MAIHINSKNEPAKCRARKGQCPFGEHFGTVEEAYTEIERVNAAEFGETAPQFRAGDPNSHNETDHQQYEDMRDSGDYQGIAALINDRVNDPDYMELIQRRDDVKEHLATLDSRLDESQGKIADANGNKIDDPALYRELIQRRRDIYENELAPVNEMMDTYRAQNAEMARTASEMREADERANGTFLSYDDETIGDMVASAEYESNSPEWHEHRRNGIGGSDVASIMKREGIYSDRANMLRKKAGVYQEPENAPDYQNDLRHPIGRGHAWEEHVRHMYADKHPEKNVAFCKTSWHDPEKPYRRANFDGLELDENGKAVGIVEIKTGSNDPKKWGDTKEGIFGVPVNYRDQVVWYASNAGLKGGTLVAVLDDNDYREYSFSMDDPRVQEVRNEIMSKTDEFWNKEVLPARRAIAEGKNPLGVRKGFSVSESMKDRANQLSMYSGESKEEAEARVRKALSGVKKDDRGRYDQEGVNAAMTKVYRESDPSKRKTQYGIDLETSSFSPKTGRVIEAAVVELNPDGSRKTVYSSLYDVPNNSTLGSEEVHHISRDMVKDKPRFESKSEQKKMLGLLKSGVIVSHNAPYEDKWLTANLDGYAEGKKDGSIKVFDTMHLTKSMMPDSKGNTLNDFVEGNGVDYVDAHRAEKDTDMMMEALHNFRERKN